MTWRLAFSASNKTEMAQLPRDWSASGDAPVASLEPRAGKLTAGH